MVVSGSCTYSRRGYRYEVQRVCLRPGLIDVALVRHGEVPRGKFPRLHKCRRDGELTLFHRSFRPLLELAALETYAGQLERVATHANNGTFGCFVVIVVRGESLQVGLYDRWFDGQRLRVDELVQRGFDPSDDEALVCSAEFLTELRERGERHDQQREAAYVRASLEDALSSRTAIERELAAEELARILASQILPPEESSS
jgi:hypothetical protein